MKNKLQNIKDYIQSLNNSELYELKDAVDHEIRMSELAIECGEERRS
jgi:hypothetical protein